jgi:DNA repair and recombination RAD54-like protein
MKKSSDIFQIHIEKSLINQMHSYQVDAVEFLCNRLMGQPEINVGQCVIPSFVTGAILADDMGTGKTLTALTVLWSLCQSLSCKALIVCPASLVSNWEAEARKWFGSSSLLHFTFVSSASGCSVRSGCDAKVHHFIKSHPTVATVLVICYELYRSFADAINSSNNLRLLICDEGHRLKNPDFTKTSLALYNCCAMSRLLLTGTPVQNNLDELYSLVNFIVPGYLGTLPEFQSNFMNYSNEGTKGEDMKLNRKEQLKELLRPILLRRTKCEILQNTLPPRAEKIVFLPLSSSQVKDYMDEVTRITGLHEVINSVDQRVDKKRRKLSLTSSSSSSSSSSSFSSSSSLKETTQGFPVSWNSVLPHLLRLRQICCSSDRCQDITNKETIYCIEDVDMKVVSNPLRGDEDKEQVNNTKHRVAIVSSSSSSSSSSFSSKESSSNDSLTLKVNNLLSMSSKLQFVDLLIHGIKAYGLTNDRIVVVSNFTDTLNKIQQLCKVRHWSHLRIDGSVPPDKRVKLVKLYNHGINSISTPPLFDVMLLSTKAGGVGLNLVGANHLVLFEPDWNPAIDAQAMGRVYRQGQTKPVFIYRLISEGTIEEAILHRQQTKDGLLSVLPQSDLVEADATLIEEDTNYIKSKTKAPEEGNSDCVSFSSLEDLIGSRFAQHGNSLMAEPAKIQEMANDCIKQIKIYAEKAALKSKVP